MMDMSSRPWIAAVLALVFALGLTVSPLAAHEDDRPAKAPVEAAAAVPAAPGDMPVTDMAWPSADSGGMTMSHEEKPTTFEGRLLAWLGMWHPAAVHFPIALLLTAAFLEVAGATLRRPIYTVSNRLLLAVATAGAFVAAPLGWLNAGLPAADDELALTVHRWLGTAMPFLLLALWRLKPPADQAPVRPGARGYEALLAATVLLVLAQSYFGAVVTHGAEHMTF